MNSLIEITTVPIEIKMTTKNATLEYTRGTAEMEISRSANGKTDIRSRSIKVHQKDRYEPTGNGQRSGSAGSNAVASRQSTYEVTGTSTRQGELLLSAKVGQEFSQLFSGEASAAQMTADAPSAAVSVNLPGSGASMNQEIANMEIRYEMDKSNFDWKQAKGEFKFTPGDIEFSVEQRPEVIIKYIGGPIYVPRSADPNYQPVDVRA